MGFPRLIVLLWAALGLAAQTNWPTQGWPISTPEAQGLDSVRLEQADQYIRSNSASRYSLLVVRNGHLVFERYYNGASASSPRHIASISKSFLSALTGIAVEQGLFTLEDRWFDTFPEYRAAVQDSHTLDARVRDGLKMSMGLYWSDADIIAWFLFPPLYPDWIRYTLSRDYENPPGQVFHYNTGLTHMMSAFLTRRSGMSTPEFARRYLFEPLGIRPGEWWRDPQGFYTGGFGMHIAPPDVAKLGYLWLHEGQWDGRQVVPAAWVRDSIGPQIRTGSGGDDFYGYWWWMDNFRGFFVPNARGMGGQYIWISKELKLVVVTTSDIYDSPTQLWRLMSDYVLPAVFQGPPAVNAGGVVDAASGQPVVAPDSFISVYGENLAPAEVFWSSVILDGRTLPGKLGGVRVRIAGRDAWLSYAGPRQVNALLPADLPAGPAEVEVSHPGGTARTTVTVAPAAPALYGYVVQGLRYAAALHAGQPVYAAAAGSLPGVSCRPARAGDNLELYASGLGRTAQAHAAGQVLAQSYPIADPQSVQVFFGAVEAPVQAVNMTYAGLWQINVQVPSGVPAGDARLTVRAAGATSPEALLSIAP